jgi:biotin operon repressor
VADRDETIHVREGRRAPYTQVSHRLLRDHRLTFKARGIAVYLLVTTQEGGPTSADAIAEANGCGRDQVQAGLRELERYGYLTREQIRDDRGSVAGLHYVITDEPQESAR